MTVSSTTRTAGPFVGTGLVSTYGFGFYVFQNTDVLVQRTDLNGNISTLVYGSDYTVTLNSNQSSSPGGTITLTTALASGYTLVMTSQVAALQSVDIQNPSNFYPSVVTKEFDYLTVLIQQLQQSINQTLTLPLAYATGVSTQLPAPVANKLIGWNATATGLQNIDASTLASIVAFGTANADIFTGDGATKVFNLTANPGAQANLDVAVGGVTQLPGIDYVWSGNQVVTFTVAPPSGVKVLLRYMRALPQGSADAGSTSFSYTASYAAGTVGTELQIKPTVVTSIASLRALPKTGVSKVIVTGYYASGDGGGGTYYYDSADTTSTDNGGTIIVATDGGRWKLASNQSLHIRTFGAKCDLTTDDYAAIQAAINAVATAGGGKLYVSQAKINTGLTLDTNKVQLVGDGGEWNFSSMAAASYALTITQSEPDVNLRTQKNRAHPVTSIRFNGPTGTTTIYGLLVNDATNNTVSGVTFRDCAFSGFINDVTLSNGAFFTLFVNCDFTNDAAGHKSQRNVNIPNATNSGENNAFVNCRFGIVVTENINQANGNASTYLTGCSFDYGARMVTCSSGSIFVSASHIEFSSDADWMFYLSTAGNPTVVISGSSFAIAAAKSAKGFAYVDALVNTTGLTIKDCTLGAINPITVPWADGTGRVTVQNVSRYTSTGYMFAPAAGSNMLAYGDFESASFTNEFNCQGTTPPARSTTVAKSGTNSLRFQGISGQVNYADCSCPCQAGQTASFSLWYYGSGITGTSTIFVANLRYLDANGGVIGSSPVFNISTDTGGWVLAVPVPSFAAAPPGTRTAQLRTIIQNTVSGTPLGYIDVVNLTVQ